MIVVRVRFSRRVFAPLKMARIDTGGVRPLQHEPAAARQFVTPHWIVIKTAN